MVQSYLNKCVHILLVNEHVIIGIGGGGITCIPVVGFMFYSGVRLTGEVPYKVIHSDQISILFSSIKTASKKQPARITVLQ